MTSRAGLSLLVALAAAGPAAAHITMTSPLVRYANTGTDNKNKNCPCGVGTGGQTCTAGVTSDPNRDPTRVTHFAPGATVTVTWTEVIGHSGRYRVAFDPDGADLADFNAHILADIADPVAPGGNTGVGDNWSVDVVLPSTPCSNCTLQLIQDMNGDTIDPIADPTGDATYFQCADIVIDAAGEGEGEGAAGEGEGEGAAGEGEGEGVAGEGEGEGGAGEGEGEGAGGEGEGEGVAGEGEGAAEGEGEGEGAGGEGEGAGGEGEAGEGEGEGAQALPPFHFFACGAARADAPLALLALLLVVVRRRPRC